MTQTPKVQHKKTTPALFPLVAQQKVKLDETVFSLLETDNPNSAKTLQKKFSYSNVALGALMGGYISRENLLKIWDKEKFHNIQFCSLPTEKKNMELACFELADPHNQAMFEQVVGPEKGEPLAIPHYNQAGVLQFLNLQSRTTFVRIFGAEPKRLPYRTGSFKGLPKQFEEEIQETKPATPPSERFVPPSVSILFEEVRYNQAINDLSTFRNKAQNGQPQTAGYASIFWRTFYNAAPKINIKVDGMLYLTEAHAMTAEDFLKHRNKLEQLTELLPNNEKDQIKFVTSPDPSYGAVVLILKNEEFNFLQNRGLNLVSDGERVPLYRKK